MLAIFLYFFSFIFNDIDCFLSSEFNYGVEDDKETIDILLTKGVDKIVTDLASLFKSDISSDELENLNINVDSLNSNIIIPKINNNLDTLKSKSDINEQ